jgi:hypothetical protein
MPFRHVCAGPHVRVQTYGDPHPPSKKKKTQQIGMNVRSSVSAIKLGVIVLSFSPRGVLFDVEVKIRKYSG